MAGRRRFGWVRKLPSGRYQASYLDPDGVRRPAPETFRTKREAEQWLATVETDLLQGRWVNPDDQRITLATFGSRWITERPGLRPRTVDLYRSLFKNHISPQLGTVSLGDLSASRVRAWRSDLLESGTSATVTAKAYRLLRAILMTAVDDEIIVRNPCRIRGAGNEHTPERPVLTIAQVFDLAARMPSESLSLFVLVKTFGSLRWGEITALRRMDVDTDSGTVWVRTAFGRPYSGKVERGRPKSRAGHRALVLPGPVLDLLSLHLKERVEAGDDALVFPGVRGGALSRNNFNKHAGWNELVEAIGMPGLHLHDLRHTGNTLAAETGATLRDLMARMGHDSMRAALIYQHRTQTGDRRIADALGGLIEQHASDAAADNDGSK